MYRFETLKSAARSEKPPKFRETQLVGYAGFAVAVGGAVFFGIDKLAIDFMSDSVAISELTLAVGAGGGTAIGSFVSSRLVG